MERSNDESRAVPPRQRRTTMVRRSKPPASEINEDRAAGAAVAGMALGMGDTLFQSLQPGDLFRFKGAPELLRKDERRHWYRLASGSRAWICSPMTVVFRANTPAPDPEPI